MLNLSKVLISLLPIAIAIVVFLQPLENLSQIAFASKEGYKTYLYDLAGRKTAQFDGRVYRSSPDGQKWITQLDDSFQLVDRSGKKLSEFDARELGFSPDGQRLFIRSTKNKLQVYDMQKQRLIQLDETSVELPEFSKNSQRGLNFTENGVSLLDQTGRRVAQIPGRFIKLTSGFASDGARFVLYRLNPESCDLFDASGQMISRLIKQCGGISADGKKFFSVTGSSDDPVLQMHNTFGKKVAQFSGLFPIFSPDRRLIVTSNLIGEKSSYLYTATGQQLAQLKGTSARFSSNSQRILTVSDNTVYLYDRLGKEITRSPGSWAAFLPNSSKFTTFLYGESVYRSPAQLSGEGRLFDQTGRPLALLKGNYGFEPLMDSATQGLNFPSSFTGDYNQNFSFISADGQRLGTSDSRVSYLYDSSGQQIAELQGIAVKFSPTGKHLITTSEDKVYLYDRSGTKLAEIQGDNGSFSLDGQRVVVTVRNR